MLSLITFLVAVGDCVDDVAVYHAVGSEVVGVAVVGNGVCAVVNNGVGDVVDFWGLKCCCWCCRCCLWV